MTDPTQELRGAIYTALSGNVRTVGGVVIPVYSFVSFEKDYPFIKIDPQVNSVPVLTKDSNNDIHEIDMSISIIQGYNGNEGRMNDVEFPMTQIVAVLANNQLSMTNYNCLLSKPVSNVESHELIDTSEILQKILTMKYTIEHK